MISAAGACQGNSCPEMEEAARAAGLLGATGPILTSCSPKTYPVIGTLTPVRGLGRGGQQRGHCGLHRTTPGSQAGGREGHAPGRAARRSPSPPAYWRSSGRAAPTAPATKRRVGEPAASPAATRLFAWPFRLCTPACIEHASRDAALQYIFALTADVDGFDGGPLWRSDNYGKPESWVDLTPEMQSEPGFTRPRGRGAPVQRLVTSTQRGARCHAVSTYLGLIEPPCNGLGLSTLPCCLLARPPLPEALPQGEQTLLGVVELHWHPEKPERILFQGKGRYHFVSTDYGATLKAVKTPKDTLGYVQVRLAGCRRWAAGTKLQVAARDWGHGVVCCITAHPVPCRA